MLFSIVLDRTYSYKNVRYTVKVQILEYVKEFSLTSASGVYKQKKEFQVQAIFTITTLFLLLINVLHIMYFGVWDSYPILEYTFFLIIIGYLGRNLALNPSLVFRLSGLSSYAIAYLSLIIIEITNIFLGDCDCLRDMPLVVDFCLNTTNCAKVNGA